MKTFPILIFHWLCIYVVHAEDAGAQYEQFVLRSKHTGDSYTIRAWFPRDYPTNDQEYPLLLMLDGEYSFNSAVDLSDYLQRDEEVDPFIIVGVSYDVGFGNPLAEKRSRDFTPPTGPEGVMEKVSTAYYQFIKEELLPEIESRYRILQSNRTLWSYSLSGAFALWLNYFDRSLFKSYIIASPNTNYGILQKILAGEIFVTDESSSKKAFMSYDLSEIDNPESYFIPNTVEFLEPLKELFAGFPGYKFRYHVTRGETHATSWLVSLPTGLRFIFGIRQNDEVLQNKKGKEKMILTIFDIDGTICDSREVEGICFAQAIGRRIDQLTKLGLAHTFSDFQDHQGILETLAIITAQSDRSVVSHK